MRKMVFGTAALAALVVVFMPGMAWAAQAGAGLAWEGPLQTLTRSIQGPVAFAISLLGVVVCGAMLVFGGEINEFVRRAIMLVLVVAMIAFAANILTGLFNYGAVIPITGSLP
jgi:type IV secretion system protein TrbC